MQTYPLVVGDDALFADVLAMLEAWKSRNTRAKSMA
jgi:hypothetical protein